MAFCVKISYLNVIMCQLKIELEFVYYLHHNLYKFVSNLQSDYLTIEC